MTPERKVRVRANHLVAKAIKSGDLIRQACEVEGCKRSPVVAHHDDYDKPLDVRWLCRLHHTAVHSAAKKDAA